MWHGMALWCMGVLDPSFRITLSCMLKKMQCLKQDKALYSCGLKILVVGSLELPMGLVSQNHGTPGPRLLLGHPDGGDLHLDALRMAADAPASTSAFQAGGRGNGCRVRKSE